MTAIRPPHEITPIHLDIPSGDAHERGRVRGEELADLIAESCALYRELFSALEITPDAQLDAAERSLTALRAWDADQHDELSAVADAAGISLLDLGLIVARTEILTLGVRREPECSTVAEVAADGSGRGAQNWDWHTEMAGTWHLQSVAAGAGMRAHVGMTEAGMTGKIGINDAGVGTMLNILSHVDDAPGGVPIHAVLAGVLARAGSLDEALEIIASAETTSSSVITVVAREGAAMVEIGPHGRAVIPVERPTAHTNHFIHPDLLAGARELSATTKSHERLADVESRLSAATGDGCLSDLLCTASDAAPVSKIADPSGPRWQRTGTIASVRMDAGACLVEAAAGAPHLASARSWATLRPGV